MADDMGIGDAGAYGGTLIQTPNIDRLAAEGTRFTQVYSGHGVCAPSRNVLMTGLHTGHTTIRGNFGKKGSVGIAGAMYRVSIPDRTVTVAEILKRAGYVTGITGKWGIGEPDTSGVPNRQGFDEWFGYLNQRRAHTYYPTFIWSNEEKFDLLGNEAEPRTQYTHDMFSAYALNFIRPAFAGILLSVCAVHDAARRVSEGGGRLRNPRPRPLRGQDMVRRGKGLRRDDHANGQPHRQDAGVA